MAIDEHMEATAVEPTAAENKATEASQQVQSSPRLILFAVDGSEESMQALDWGLSLLSAQNDKLQNVKLHLLHVQQNLPLYGMAAAPGYIPPPEVVIRQQKMEDERSLEVLQRAKELCVRQHKVHASAEVVLGDARDVICHKVEKLKPELLVVGSHGYGALQRAFLGSVSSYLVNHATCPVLVVRPTGDKKHDKAHQ